MTPFQQTINWRPGPAQGVEGIEIFDGDQFWVAVRVCDRERKTEWWEFSCIHIKEDGIDVEGAGWGWDWSDVEWYVPISEFKNLPVVERQS